MAAICARGRDRPSRSSPSLLGSVFGVDMERSSVRRLLLLLTTGGALAASVAAAMDCPSCGGPPALAIGRRQSLRRTPGRGSPL